MHTEESATGPEVSFPPWVKVLAWIIGMCFPLALLVGSWMLSTIMALDKSVALLQQSLSSNAQAQQTEIRALTTMVQYQIEALDTRVTELETSGR